MPPVDVDRGGRISGDFASEESVVRHAAGRVTGALLALGGAALAGRA